MNTLHECQCIWSLLMRLLYKQKKTFPISSELFLNTHLMVDVFFLTRFSRLYHYTVLSTKRHERGGGKGRWILFLVYLNIAFTSNLLFWTLSGFLWSLFVLSDQFMVSSSYIVFACLNIEGGFALTNFEDIWNEYAVCIS